MGVQRAGQRAARACGMLRPYCKIGVPSASGPKTAEREDGMLGGLA